MGCEPLLHHVQREGLADLDGHFLDVGELGAPGNTVGAVNPAVEIFCKATQEILQFILDDRGGFGVRHPWLLPEVASREKVETDLTL